MNNISNISSVLNAQSNTPNDSSWNTVMNLLQGDLKYMQGSQPAVEEQFQHYLMALKPYATAVGGNTLNAYNDLEDAFRDYKKHRHIGTAKMESALSKLQANPLNLTDAQFQSATLTLIDQFSKSVASGDLQRTSDFMGVLFELTYNSDQLPQEYKNQFTGSTTPFMTAYNTFMQSLVTPGAPPPTQQEIDDLLTQIDDLKKTV